MKVLIIEANKKKEKIMLRYLKGLGINNYSILNSQTFFMYALEQEHLLEEYDLILLGMRCFIHPLDSETTVRAGYNILYNISQHYTKYYNIKKIPVIIYYSGEYWKNSMNNFFLSSLSYTNNRYKDLSEKCKIINSIDFVIGQTSTKERLRWMLNRWWTELYS